MAALRRPWLLGKAVKACLKQSRSIATTSKLSGEWNQNWMPGPYPRTKEEREAAAKKYGLLPEDYKPMPDDGSAHGDYPDLPFVGEEQKSPWEAWDDPGLVRNYGEPMHIGYEVITGDRSDPAMKYPYSPAVMFTTLIGVILGFCTTWFLAIRYAGVRIPMYNEWYPYEEGHHFYPGDPKPSMKRTVHYTFEPSS